MINLVLSEIVDQLNEFLKRAFERQENSAILSDLVDQEGKMAFKETNVVICTLIALEQEKVLRNHLPQASPKMNPPILVNLDLLFTCYFPGNYQESLKYLSLVISFFQSKSVFTSANSPGLPLEVDKVQLEVLSADPATQREIWSSLGAKLMPSVFIKLRTLPILTQ